MDQPRITQENSGITPINQAAELSEELKQVAQAQRFQEVSSENENESNSGSSDKNLSPEKQAELAKMDAILKEFRARTLILVDQIKTLNTDRIQSALIDFSRSASVYDEFNPPLGAQRELESFVDEVKSELRAVLLDQNNLGFMVDTSPGSLMDARTVSKSLDSTGVTFEGLERQIFDIGEIVNRVDVYVVRLLELARDQAIQRKRNFREGMQTSDIGYYQKSDRAGSLNALAEETRYLRSKIGFR